MGISKRLVMGFKTDDGSSTSLSIDDPKEDLTEEQIKTAMDLVISKNIFAPNGLDIVEAVDAQIIVTDTTDFDLV